jgi:site-specific DNA recombinase
MTRRHSLIYVRQSYRRRGENADADVSPEAQEKAARAALPTGASAEVISDTGGHRSGRTDARDGYQELLRRLCDPDVAGVAVYDLSRLARNIHLMLDLKRELDDRGLRLIVANLPGSTFDDSIGKFMFNQLCSAAQFQADIDSDRMIAVTRTKHERGGHNGRDPYGFSVVRDNHGKIVQPHRLEAVPEEAQVIRLIFDEYGHERHSSHGAFAADLNARGITRRGRAWNEKSVADILRRAPFYLGNAVYRRGEDIRPGTHEPVITTEQAHLAQRVAARRRRPGRSVLPHRHYILKGLVHCGSCGRRLRSETVMRTGRKEYSYYRCPGRRDHTCTAPNIYTQTADQAVIDHIADGVSTPELVVLAREELRKMRHVPNEALSLQRQRLETAIKRLGDRYQWQEIDEPEYRTERAKLQAQLAELPPPMDSNVLAFDRTGEQLLPIATIIRETTPEHQAALIKHIVERVTVTDGAVTGIELRPEARPFYAGLVMAPPDGRGASTAKPEEKLAAFL